MAPHKIEHAGKQWRTPEALFQALRYAESDPTREKIWAATSPMTAKMLSKQFGSFRVIVPQGVEDVENMRMILRLKLEQHPKLIPDLLALKGVTIIEDCSARRNASGLFWGAAWEDSLKGWVGTNTLGKLWMEIVEAADRENTSPLLNIGVV
jgi:predicted NAD-dependent protein-ADP-ribosyltransferase YbiA (DUF1768 family)